MLLAVFMTGFLAAAAPALPDEAISCQAIETAGDNVEAMKLTSTVSIMGDLIFVGSSARYNYTVIFKPDDFEDYWALIEKLPTFKPAVHAEGRFRTRDSNPGKKYAHLEYYDETINVMLVCTK